MSAKTDEILESLKSLSLLEASELVKQIEDAFGVSAAASAGVVMAAPGAAAGGGLGLALACDARIAAPQAKLAAAFFKLGLSPDGGTTWLLPRLVGNQVTRRFFFNDEVWSGEEAQEKGAVDTVVAMDVLIDTAVDWAANWGKWSQLSRSGTKQLLDASTSTFFQTQLEFEQALIIAASQTKEFEEGVAAFLEKRDPEFD